jgi:hypothetical protein
MNESKYRILAEIKRQAEANNGRALGEEAFRKETGIQRSAWWPLLWVNWGDAIQEAGLPRNVFTTAIDEKLLLEKYARLARSLGRMPVHGELRRQKAVDSSFPTDQVFFRRYGGKNNLVKAMLEYCEASPEFGDVASLCRAYLEETATIPRRAAGASSETVVGYVYLIKSGRHHKIGRTNSIGRREWELGIKIPIPPKTIHFIETDDPVGVEAYWHRRFAEKRGEGEWFNLTAEDVAAFKRGKKIT